MITDKDMKRQVIAALDGREGDYKVNKIVDDIQAVYGTVDIDDVPDGEFWDIVAKRERD
jgi:hypothetical protein